MTNKNTKMPIVSVLIPIYNVEKFLDQCLNSLLKQDIKSAEFICLNDGSTDNSLAIIKKYQKLDSRFKLLDKPNSGYGDTMNQGIKIAKGKYIGIVESDDWAEPNMFSDLVKLAEDNKADAVKSNFYFYSGLNGGSSKKHNIVSRDELGFVLEPKYTPHIFKAMSTIWSGLYKKDFLVKNKIDFLPTPGASYQDTGFNFKVWAMAKRAVYTDKAYLHYRIDNEASSVKSRSKVFCVCDEFESIRKYLVDHKLMKTLSAVYTERKIDIYRWNLSRLSGKNRADFYKRTIKELLKDQKNGYLDSSLLDKKQQIFFEQVLHDKYLLARLFNRAACFTKRVAHFFYKKLSFKNKAFVLLKDLIKSNDILINNLVSAKQSLKTNYVDSNTAVKPIVSVIVPAYNAEKTIAKTINSLIKQTLKSIEIIVIDDGSTDSTAEIVKDLAKKDKRIKYYFQKNQGVAVARNTGIKKSTGKYIMWCDSDDTFNINMCLKMVGVMENRMVDMAICRTNTITDNIDHSLKKDTEKYLDHKYKDYQLISFDLIVQTDVSLWNKIFRRDIIIDNNIMMPRGLLFEDAYFCSAYMLCADNIYYLKDRLYNYVRQPDSIMSKSFKKSTSSLDYLKIAIKLHDFLKFSNLFDKHIDLFWLRFIQSYSYASDNLDAKDKVVAKNMADNFIKDNIDDFNAASDGMKKAVEAVVNKRDSLVAVIKYQLKRSIKATIKCLPIYKNRAKLLSLKYHLASQIEYINFLNKTSRR